MDVRKLAFPNESFDLIIDKGTFDCVVLDQKRKPLPSTKKTPASDTKEEGKLDVSANGGAHEALGDVHGSVHEMLMELSRVMKQSCKFYLFSLFPPEQRMPHLDQPDLYHWRVQYLPIPFTPLELPDQKHTHLYLITKQ